MPWPRGFADFSPWGTNVYRFPVRPTELCIVRCVQKAGHQACSYVHTRNRGPSPRLLTYATMNVIDGLQSV